MKNSTKAIFDKICEITEATYPKGFKNPVQELKDCCRMYFLHKGELQECLLDKEDIKLLDYNVTWVGNLNGSGDKVYIVANWLNKRISLHRVLTNFPVGMVIDHINGNTFDNRRCNIRVVTTGVNMLNKKDYNTSTTKERHIIKSRGHYKLAINRQFNDINIAIKAKEAVLDTINYYSNLDAAKRTV
jgi:hypothetical protein